MKKLFMAVLIALVAMFCQSAQAEEKEWQPNMDAPVADVLPADVTNFGGEGPSIKIEAVDGGLIRVILDGVKLTPKGVSEILYDADVIRIASGILDAAKTSGDKRVTSEYVAEKEPIGGQVVFTIANYAKVVGVPVVEHLWGIGRSKGDNQVKFLVLSPDSPWVVYETLGNGKPNLETLAIGIVMCPEGQAIPLKSINKGKLKQGKHPELAAFCMEESKPIGTLR